MSNSTSLSRMSPDDRRGQIVEVAARHFADAGYDRASMSAIAREAGVTRALVYHYFAGKEALVEAVLRNEADDLLADTAPDPTLSTYDNLVRALHAYLDRFAASRGQLRDLYTPHPMTPSVVGEIATANHDVQVARLLEMLGQPETARLRLALSAWLAFVEEAARGFTGAGVGRDEFVHLSLTALQAVTGQPLTITIKEKKP